MTTSVGDVVSCSMVEECVTELQEQCAQEEVRLASCAAELARSVDAASVGKSRDEHDVIAGPSLDHGDDVGRLLGHQGASYVTKLLNTNEALGTESGQRECAKEYLELREKAVRPPKHRERRSGCQTETPRLPENGGKQWKG